MMPAPSPVSGSQPQAPRCSSRARIESALLMISCERTPLRLAVKPTPQLECSVKGS